MKSFSKVPGRWRHSTPDGLAVLAEHSWDLLKSAQSPLSFLSTLLKHHSTCLSFRPLEFCVALLPIASPHLRTLQVSRGSLESSLNIWGRGVAVSP